MSPARVFLYFSLFFLFITSREPPWADSHVVYDTTQALVDRAALDVHTEGGPPWFYAHKDGKKYGVFPLGNVVAMVPSYLFFKVTKKLLPASVPEKPLFAFTCHLSPALMMAGACTIFFVLCRRRMASARWSLLLTVALGAGTIITIYARSPYAEAVQTLAMMWLVERALDQAEAPTTAGLAWLGCAAGVLVNTKLVYALCLPPVVAYLAWRQRHALGRLVSRSWLALIMFAELIAVLLLHNRMKTGSLLDSGYHYKDGVFSGDFFSALYGFTLSTGKSALLYSPPILLGVLGVRTALARRRAESVFLLTTIATVVAFNAKFRVWHADYCWGPRYLTPITPLVLLLAVPWLPEACARGRAWLRRTLLGALLGAGVAVQAIGACFYWDHYIRVLIAVKDQTGASGWFTESLSHGHYIPEFSPIRGHLWLLSHLIHQDPDLSRDAPWRPVIPYPSNQSDAWHRLRPDWWLLDWGHSP